MTVSTQQLDPLSVGKKLLVNFVLAGNFLRSEQGFGLQLAAARRAEPERPRRRLHQRSLVRPCQRPVGYLQRGLQHPAGLRRLSTAAKRHLRARRPASPSEGLSEDYLQARALLSSFMSRTGSRDDLDRAREIFDRVVAHDADYAPGWSGLGITQLQYARYGLGGQMQRARSPPRLR